MATTTPNLGYPLMSANQAAAHVIFNHKAILDDILFGGLDGLTTTSTPPGSPANGDVYLVGAAATGAWSAQDGKVAIYYDGVWSFYALPTIWSTTEVATQLYRDGAQVYQKVVSMGSGPAAGDKTVSAGITGLDTSKPINLEFWARSASFGLAYSGPVVWDPLGSVGYILFLNLTTGNLTWRTSFDISSFTGVVRMQYSKT